MNEAQTNELDEKSMAVWEAVATLTGNRHTAFDSRFYELLRAVTDAVRVDERQKFYERVCARAEANMLKTGKLEGSHFAAMKAEIANQRE